MTNLAKKALLGLAMGATVMTVAAPAADAQHRGGGGRGGSYHGGGGYRGGGYRGGGAFAAGVTGLALGAALAGGPYYNRGYYSGYYPGCYNRLVWSRYAHRRVWVRYCD